MPVEIIKLFSISENQSVLNSLLQKLTPPQSPNITNLANPLRLIVEQMARNPEKFDTLCQENIKWIGSSFIELARSLKVDEHLDDAIADLFARAYRFMCEFSFGTPGELIMELQSVRAFVENNFDTFPPNLKQQVSFANYLMPVSIVKTMLHHPNSSAMWEFDKRCDSAAKLKKQWDEEVSARESKVDSLKKELEKLETGFNFVGLVDGFRRLAESKRKEKQFAFTALVALGFLVLLPVLAEMVFVGLYRSEIKTYQEALIFALPPLVTIEILLVYFFRVVLVHFRSIKAQLLQLELRTSLCQFIQSYSTYAKEIKNKDASALDKFESLIFSGLISSEENLPSTFDGTEQLAKLFKSIKGAP